MKAGNYMNFPKDFIWGAASASYQIEGGFDADGKGPSIWDVFSHTTGKISDNSNGDVACNHYYDYEKDVALLKELGITSYRFSINWPRVFPKGDKVLNQKGLDFYDKLVNLLIKNGITPYMTLYHWELPQALEDIGGWMNRNITDNFAYFAGFMIEHFSDRVTNYFTINEPQCIAFLGYGTGMHAPGKMLSDVEVVEVFHNIGLAHGKAVKEMRSKAKQPIKIGFASTGTLCYPSVETQADINLARELTFASPTENENWGFIHQIIADPVILGKYADLSAKFDESNFTFRKEGDLKIMCQPIDYFGINVYNGHEVSTPCNGYVPKYYGFPRTALRWPVTPGVMNYGLRFIYERYQVPVIVSENGQSCNDRIFLDGKVHDPDRIDFLERYFMELEKSVVSDSKIIGYFQWALTDNFEWSSGYLERFGLIYVDYQTQERILKDSALWYSKFIKENA